MDMILITGGLGYIGSHTVVELLEVGHKVMVVDDLSNSTMEVLKGIERATGKRPIFERVCLNDRMAVKSLFHNYREINGIIHFAASKAVGESVSKPLLYYDNNLSSLIYLLQEVETLNRQVPFIFSSSCTVYGEPDSLPINEDAPLKKATSPYGNTKQIGEEILWDTVQSSDKLSAVVLRYFNPVGAHGSLEIGELPLGTPQNLVPFITQTAMGVHNKLTVFGNDYPTIDGTCVRDYIHVVDLAKAHVMALQRHMQSVNEDIYEVFNLGTGQGQTVLEVISCFERASGIRLDYEIGPRRKGDVIAAYADIDKANGILGWKARFSIHEAIGSAWEWEQKIRNNN
ncbi:MAG: UDP-glucose 4-epimerase GalE [Bacteroidota bacterium]